MRFRRWVCLAFAGVLSLVGSNAFATEHSVSELLGRVVVTPQGELLGRIEDLRVDLEGARIEFVVVSIGSYLIDDNLVAVHPDALGASQDGNYLVVYTDDLDAARRFSAGNWPAAPDVLPSADRAPVVVDQEQVAGSQGDTARSDTDVVATISDGRRTATMKEGDARGTIEEAYPERRVAVQDKPVTPKVYQSNPSTVLSTRSFDKLDDDGDGYLSRREIAVQLDRTQTFAEFDLDGNDGIDAFEYQFWLQRQ